MLIIACVAVAPLQAQQALPPPGLPGPQPDAGASRRPSPDAEQIEKRKIILDCGAEGRLALRVAVDYFEVNGQSKDATLAYAAQAGAQGTRLANELFPQINTGVITGAPRYATQRTIKCLEAASFPMDREVTVEMSDLCWARSDAIYHSALAKQAGSTREQSEAALLQRFANPVAFPPAYLKEVNNIVYDKIAGMDQANESQVPFYLTCLVAQVRAASRK
jgi:hypothetical protein